MNRTPVPAAIQQAELRVSQSSLKVSSSLCRARAALRTTLARPSTLVMVAGATGLFCFWLARRTQSRSSHPVNGIGEAATTSVLGLILAFVLRYGMRRLGTIIR